MRVALPRRGALTGISSPSSHPPTLTRNTSVSESSPASDVIPSPASVTKGGKSPLDFMRANAPKFSAESVAATGKLALAVVAAGEDPRAFAGSDLVAQIEGAQGAQGAYGLTPTDHAFALLARPDSDPWLAPATR